MKLRVEGSHLTFTILRKRTDELFVVISMESTTKHVKFALAVPCAWIACYIR
jgi:hypothetical protein